MHFAGADYFRWVLAFLLITLLAGCHGSGRDWLTQSQLDAGHSLPGVWLSESLPEVIAWPESLREPVSLRLDIQAGKAYGFSGINRFYGTLEVEDKAIRIHSVASTRMGGPEELINIESQFLDLLQRVDAWSVEDGKLSLFAGDKLQLTFIREN